MTSNSFGQAQKLSMKLTGVALALALAGVAGCGGKSGGDAKSPDESTAKSTSAAEIDAEFVTGEGPKSLADAKGKVVIVDFWATYCDPCKKSFPKYQELVDQFGGDLAVIAVSVDEKDDVSAEKLTDFAKETGVKFSIVWDKEHKTADSYKPPKMPTSYILDREGNIRYTHAGYESGEEEKIAAEIKELAGK